MQTEIERIKKLFVRNWSGPMWHGATLQEILKDISWQAAFRKPENFSHNIYEYVLHMLCWRKFSLEHLCGNSSYTVDINSETDWVVKYEPTEAAWQQVLKELEENQNALEQVLEKFDNGKLEERVPGKKFSWYVLLHGAVHHDIYHSAQISLLKKFGVK